jgi:hypothetical protein
MAAKRALQEDAKQAAAIAALNATRTELSYPTAAPDVIGGILGAIREQTPGLSYPTEAPQIDVTPIPDPTVDPNALTPAQTAFDPGPDGCGLNGEALGSTQAALDAARSLSEQAALDALADAFGPGTPSASTPRGDRTDAVDNMVIDARMADAEMDDAVADVLGISPDALADIGWSGGLADQDGHGDPTDTDRDDNTNSDFSDNAAGAGSAATAGVVFRHARTLRPSTNANGPDVTIRAAANSIIQKKPRRVISRELGHLRYGRHRSRHRRQNHRLQHHRRNRRPSDQRRRQDHRDLCRRDQPYQPPACPWARRAEALRVALSYGRACARDALPRPAHERAFQTAFQNARAASFRGKYPRAASFS